MIVSTSPSVHYRAGHLAGRLGNRPNPLSLEHPAYQRGYRSGRAKRVLTTVAETTLILIAICVVLGFTLS